MPPTGFLIGILIMILFAVIVSVLHAIVQKYNDSQPITSHCVRIGAKRKDGKFKWYGTSSVYVLEKQRKYYIAFEFDSTKKIKEFAVPEIDYDIFKEGDLCILNLQGTRYISLELREKSDSIKNDTSPTL